MLCLLVVIAWCIGAAGCAGGGNVSDEAMGISRSAGEASVSEGAVSPPAAGVRFFEASDGFADGVRWVESAATPGDSANGLVVTRRLLDGTGEPIDTTEQRTIIIDDEGVTRMQRLVNTDRGIAFVFDPPAPIRPATGASSTGAIEWNGAVTEVDPRTGRVKRTGTASASVRVVGSGSAELLSGERTDATEVLTELTMRFGPATIRRSVRAWHAPGLGIVATHEFGTLSIAGFTRTTADRSMRRVTEADVRSLSRTPSDEAAR